MDFIAPILASAGFVIIVQLIINIADHSNTFRQWRSHRKATIEDELHSELKRQSTRLEKENEILRVQVDDWQEKYYRLLVDCERLRAATTEPPPKEKPVL